MINLVNSSSHLADGANKGTVLAFPNARTVPFSLVIVVIPPMIMVKLMLLNK